MRKTDRLEKGEEPRRGLSELLEGFGVVVELKPYWLSCIAERARHKDLDLRGKLVKGLKGREGEVAQTQLPSVDSVTSAREGRYLPLRTDPRCRDVALPRLARRRPYSSPRRPARRS